MCGIFGIVYRDGNTVPDEALLGETGRILGHRGPDSAGSYQNAGIGLVHTRLSLLDLSRRSDQPFWDEQQRYALVYNGEIYNFQALRTELEARGVVFRTTSDTEVLLHGIIRHGLDAFLPRLEGMFAFALWDSEQRTLVLVRDRFGIKPLSVYEDDRVLVFASEIKAIRPWIPLLPDPQAASAYLSGFGGPTRDRSFFRDVVMLSPGSIREVRSRQRSTERSFFHITEFWHRTERERLHALGAQDVVDHFEDLLLTSVKKHLIADAPVGALCSGGIDSSLVMAMASKFHTNLAIFHANVKGPLSEYEAAKALSKHLHLDLRTVDVHDEDFIEQLPAVTRHYEYPFFRHPNSVPFLLVSRLVRASGVKAILSGEGSDECFLGYGPIAFEDLRQGYRRALTNLRNLVHRVPKFGKAVWPHDPGYAPLVHGMEQNFEVALDRARIQGRIQKVGIEVRPREYRSLEWLGYHLRTVLHRNDALGMAASIEARFPYLDHDVVRAAVNLPYEYKIRPSLTALDRAHPFLRDKWVVRKVADRYIPRALSQRKKLGFPVNAYERMRITPAFFKGGFVADLYRLSEPALLHLLDNADRLFQVRLLMLEVWGRLFFQGAREAELVAELLRHTAIDPIPA
jgi:asparagine synthase (glutamine-hydrolysing)